MVCQEFAEPIHPFDDFVMYCYLIISNGVVVDEFGNGCLQKLELGSKVYKLVSDYCDGSYGGISLCCSGCSEFFEVQCNVFIIEFLFTLIEAIVNVFKLSIYVRDNVRTDGCMNSKFVPIQFKDTRPGDESVINFFLLDLLRNDIVFKGLEGLREVAVGILVWVVCVRRF